MGWMDDVPSSFPGKMATINYQVSDCGDRFTISPVCYFDCKGNKAKVKLDPETGCLMIKPKRAPAKKDQGTNVTRMIGGGYLFVPKKVDLSQDPIIRHEGPVGQLLKIDLMKLPQYKTEYHPLKDDTVNKKLQVELKDGTMVPSGIKTGAEAAAAGVKK